MKSPRQKITVILVLAVLFTAVIIPVGISRADDSAPGRADTATPEKEISTSSDVITFDGKQYRLAFSDDFNTLDTSKWALLPEQKRQDNGGEWRDSCSSVKNGNYIITCDMDEDGTPISGGIRSTEDIEQTFGLYHIRFKAEKADGLWYAFWLLTDRMNESSVGNGATDGAELDIFELVPHTTEFCMSVHWDGYGKDLKSRFETEYVKDSFYNRYHDVWYVWNKDGYRLFLDGKLTFDFPGKEYGDGTCAVPCDMILSAEFGTWGGDPDKSQLPARYYVDKVEIYKEVSDAPGPVSSSTPTRKPTAAPGGGGSSGGGGGPAAPSTQAPSTVTASPKPTATLTPADTATPAPTATIAPTPEPTVTPTTTPMETTEPEKTLVKKEKGVTYSVKDGTATVIKVPNKKKVTIIKKIRINGASYKVTSLQDKLFRKHGKVHRITIQVAYLESIGKHTFDGIAKDAVIRLKGSKQKKREVAEMIPETGTQEIA